jgi:hypothetical protein
MTEGESLARLLMVCGSDANSPYLSLVRTFAHWLDAPQVACLPFSGPRGERKNRAGDKREANWSEAFYKDWQ